jgi:REP element-mobilizing transposase RayT
LDEWVVMPNHVHVLCEPVGGNELSEILHSWKSYTANELNGMLGTKGEVFWQDESYNQIVRSEGHLVVLRKYVRSNLAKAGVRVWDASWLGVV